ncbi:unnamed protein product [Spirodela intermedia]|uniref:cytokinin dehydrogenase n=1 Tax=Spirodela intermedia TaxID=51605 RepID=A0A7I8IMA2_SPIIN|nr:unnamed protein product [Spirodela intermedia]CAA6658928.1 unnamed protein product [Spirodela intermedia]
MTIPALLVAAVVGRLISTAALGDAEILRHHTIGRRLSLEPDDLDAASKDFGGTVTVAPLAVLRPATTGDVAGVVHASYRSPLAFPVSARGHGHCTGGQAAAAGGVVVAMTTERRRWERREETQLGMPEYSPSYGGYFVDVWGGELWADVLRWTLRHGGLAPRSWTDYLYLSVGGTLSNGGISGQAFRHGPQISNVYEMDVVTGKGDLVRCSREQNQDLFHAVLGGLGQFGIITRARIALERAPRGMLFADFREFTRDQEYLISLEGRPSGERFDYVEGFVVLDDGLINNWRSSFFSPRNLIKLSSLGSAATSVLYCLEVAMNYDDSTAGSVDQDVAALLRKLQFMPETEFATDLPYVDFLDRVHKKEQKLREEGLWEVPHPWLNLFVPSSRIADFDQGIFKGILRRNKVGGPILIYPMNRTKWEETTSAVTPEEEVFYLVAFLRSAVGDSPEELQKTLRYLTRQNELILGFCRDSGIPAKQYLPSYGGRRDWEEHFGHRWETFLRRKMEFDPKGILGTGQGIFQLNSVIVAGHDAETKTRNPTSSPGRR